MSKSKNSNKDNFRAKWDMAHGIDTDYRRSSSKKIIEEELDLMEEEEHSNGWDIYPSYPEEDDYKNVPIVPSEDEEDDQ